MDKEFFFKTDQLVIWRPTGVLDTNKIYHFIDYLNTTIKEREPHFSRFIDLSQISGISVKYNELSPIAEQRKKYYSSHLTQKTKMTFYVTNPLSLGMARMYQTLGDDVNLETTIYNDLNECARFLEVDISILSP